VQVDDETLVPRQRIISVALSLRSGDADSLQGFTPDDFAKADHTHNLSDIEGEATDAQIPNST